MLTFSCSKCACAIALPDARWRNGACVHCSHSKRLHNADEKDAKPTPQFASQAATSDFPAHFEDYMSNDVLSVAEVTYSTILQLFSTKTFFLFYFIVNDVLQGSEGSLNRTLCLIDLI
jgi:hypothetical protein